jgi:hypothetical protein
VRVPRTIITIETVLAGIAVTDHPSAIRWYQRLFGSPPTRLPMDAVAEWQVADGACVRIVRSPEPTSS